MPPAAKRDEVMIEGADIMFRNFSGLPGQYNAEGDRNFCVMLDNEQSAAALDHMRREGWNIKTLKPREEGDEPRPYIQVKVEYRKGRPPQCVLVSSRRRTELGADEVAILDVADIANVDVLITGYHWDVNGETGVKAYLKSIYVTINEDALALKYADKLEADMLAEVSTSG